MSFGTELARYKQRQKSEYEFLEWKEAGCQARFNRKEYQRMTKKQFKADDLSDILGDSDTPATKEKSMGTKEKAVAAAAALKASKDKAKKPNGKSSEPAPKAKAAKEKSAPREAGKYNFPVGSKEREALKAKVVKLKKAATTKEVAAQLKAETWQVRLVAVELVAEKKLKMVKSGTTFTLQPR